VPGVEKFFEKPGRRKKKRKIPMQAKWAGVSVFTKVNRENFKFYENNNAFLEK
jgi:hypothetical protein